jgi:hypothetical protein
MRRIASTAAAYSRATPSRRMQFVLAGSTVGAVGVAWAFPGASKYVVGRASAATVRVLSTAAGGGGGGGPLQWYMRLLAEKPMAAKVMTR